MPQVPLDECQAKIDPRRDASLGPHRTVLDKDGIRFHVKFRVRIGEATAFSPMGDDASAIEQATSSQKERPGAYRYDPSRFSRPRGEPAAQLRVFIARDVGYDDLASFRRLFCRLAGMTPGVYRRQFQFPQHVTPQEGQGTRARDAGTEQTRK